MKVTVVCHDVSQTCLTRAHLLARLLCARHDVEIVGTASGAEVWKPLRDATAVPVRILTGDSLDSLAAQLDGDVLYAVKPRPTSLDLALAARAQRSRPLIVDVDDWESGFLYDDVRAMVRSGFRHESRWVLRQLLDRGPNNARLTRRTERRIGSADQVTTSSTWLARRYDGTVVPQARDLSQLSPHLVDREQVRAELGLSPDQVVLLFMGRPRRHKGVEQVLAAMTALGRPDLVLLTVGGDPGVEPRPDLRVMGWQPFADTARFLAAADMVVLASDTGPGARGQMPMKLYDAMAMGRPVVVTDVSDMAATVVGCGLVVPPGDTTALARAIATLADDPALRRRLGDAARSRCVAEFSDEAVRPQLLAVVERAVAGHDPYPVSRRRQKAEPRSAASSEVIASAD
ncbi:hypothetical protein acdb102_46150 [Acidothermaceae bacterium B102]|nr:hypothetical protein acdb102_46150 [Acidothermaceae bacterium B102]